MNLTVEGIIAACQHTLDMRWFSPEHVGQDRDVVTPGAEPADLVGYLNMIHRRRLHVIGAAEIAYTQSLDPQRRDHLIRDLIEAKPPAILLAEGLEPPDYISAAAVADQLPILGTAQSPARAVGALRTALARATAEKISVHGVFMDVLGMGVLISGDSGLGKSELALELISRGHGLVADDVVEFSRIADNAIEGRCPVILQNLLEVRGLGLLDIRTIFGETAVRRKMRLKLIVHLIGRNKADTQIKRLPLEALTQNMIGMPVRKVVIPVAAGRNLAVLTEGAVRSTVLQLRGIDTTGEFIARQRRLIDESSN